MNPFETEVQDNTSNPFSGMPDAPTGSNPFETVSPANVIKEATNEAKVSALQDAKHLYNAARNLSNQAAMAKKIGSQSWLDKIRDYGRRLALMLMDFVKKAVHLAACKLLLELCAMIISKLMDTLIKGNNKMDITTPGVAYYGQGAHPGMQHPGMQNNNNPFSGGFDQRFSAGAAVSPW